MTKPTQLPLPLPVKPALGREDYFLSSSNALAVSLIADWRNWPGRKLLLLGPTCSGKTHLAHVWAADSGAHIIAAADLHNADVPTLASFDICVEDVDQIASDPAAQTALFHLHNLVLAQGRSLLLTAATPPARWGLGLPDLVYECDYFLLFIVTQFSNSNIHNAHQPGAVYRVRAEGVSFGSC